MFTPNPRVLHTKQETALKFLMFLSSLRSWSLLEYISPMKNVRLGNLFSVTVSVCV